MARCLVCNTRLQKLRSDSSLAPHIFRRDVPPAWFLFHEDLWSYVETHIITCSSRLHRNNKFKYLEAVYNATSQNRIHLINNTVPNYFHYFYSLLERILLCNILNSSRRQLIRCKGQFTFFSRPLLPPLCIEYNIKRGINKCLKI